MQKRVVALFFLFSMAFGLLCLRIVELNDSTAADFLYEQLPITTEVENYSTNEKIFYPSRELDTSDSPVAEGGAEQISEMSGTIVIDIAD